ncbi:unnamed protein product [Sphacelaria rigidula]
MLSIRRRPQVIFWLCALVFVLFGSDVAPQIRALATGEKSSPGLAGDVAEDGQCWIFTHLQKCGGSTVKAIIEGQWGKRQMIFDTNQWKSGEKVTAKFAKSLVQERKWDAVAGGYTEALRPYVGDRCKWFIMFRHPVSRLVSAYFYCQRLPADTACGSGRLNAKEADLVTFAKHWGNFGLRQFALALVDQNDVLESDWLGLSGGDPRDRHDSGWYIMKRYLETEGRKLEGTVGEEDESLPEDRAMDDMLQPVRDLLRDNFTAVGILESFDDTLELFNRALEVPGLDWRSQFKAQGSKNVDNQYKEREKAALAEAWTNAEIKKYINLDLLIYEHAVAVFNQQKRLYSI